MNRESDLINKNFAGCTILEKIGQGGMGTVYKAHYHLLNKTVCVKILSKELSYDQRNIEFFMREARSASKLDHPNIVHVYKYGEENGNYYIVMSYVEGKTLQDIINEKKVLDIPEATDYIIGILEGLAHAHSKNIIHRDIKPSNILITKDGLPRIADFGLARSVNEEKQLTIAGEMVGTAYFMSPEQGLAKKVDTRADLYAVGATYFYLVTGKYPYEGKTSIEVISKHINEPFPNIFAIKPDIPLWTAKVIEKLMKKDPAERYQTAEEVLQELKKYKEKNYVVDLSTEKDYDISEIEKRSIEANVKPKVEEKKPSIEGLVIDNYSVSDSEKESSSEKSDTSKIPESQKKDTPSKIESFQLTTFSKATKLIWHFSLLLLAFIFTILLGGAYQNPDNLLLSLALPFIKWTTSSLIISLLIFGFSYLAIRLKPMKITPLYSFYLFLMLTTAYIGSNYTNYPPQTEWLAKFFINLKNSISGIANPENFWAFSITFLIITTKISSKDKIFYKLISSILFLVTFLLFYAYLKKLSPPGLKLLNHNYDYLIYSLLFLAVLSNIIRGIIYLLLNPLLLIVISYILLFSSFKEANIKYILDNKVKQEEARVEKERQLAILAIKTKALKENEMEIPEYDEEGKPIIKKENTQEKIKKVYEEIKPKPVEELEIIAKQEFKNYLSEKIFHSLRNSGGLIIISIVIFLVLNIMFFEEMLIYEKEFM